MIGNLSPTALSNLVTIGVTSCVDTRQSIPDRYEIPDVATRKLRARLIMEEAIETVNALGFDVSFETDHARIVHSGDTKIEFYDGKEPDLVGIIDGCCDTIYVATAALCAVGAPDLSHLTLVHYANESKFPGGQVIKDAHGKYLKPAGWTPPNHKKLIDEGYNGQFTLKRVSEILINSWSASRTAP